MSSSVSRWLPLALVALAALWLRTHDLAHRPMHADEANQAVKLGELIESGHYAFDPHDHHGPTLYYLALPIAWLSGEKTLTTLTERTVRLLPALAGTLSVLLLAMLVGKPGGAAPQGPPKNRSSRAGPGSAADQVRRSSDCVEEDSSGSPVAATKVSPANSGRSLSFAALAAAAFLALSPPAVYYSRYFIQETLLVTFTLGAFLCVTLWWRRASCGWAFAAGACVGLMFATKATAPLFLAAGAIACFALTRGRARPTQPKRKFVRDLLLALAIALFVAALFYSSFGTHFAGLRDAVRVYGFAAERATGGSGHEKPWWYYLQLFGWKRDGGLVWEQLAFSALAVCGAGLTLTSRLKAGVFRWAALYTVIIATVLSLTPYKTPWHAVHLVPGLAVLAAGALTAFPRWWISALLAVVVLWMQYSQTRLAVFLRPADARNSYAYVHSSPDVRKFRPLAESALAHSADGIVRVISEEYWPLPWYFRGLPRVGYWSTPPDNCDGSLVITSVNLAETVRARLHGAYHESYLGLRPGFVCIVFTPVP